MTAAVTQAPATRRRRADLGALIGRFQFPHLGHVDAIEQALESVDQLAILLGSANRPRTYFAPFTATEREAVLRDALPRRLLDRVHFVPLPDYLYNNTRWIAGVHAAVGSVVDKVGAGDPTVALAGFKKDGTSYYLNMFPRWGEVEVRDTTGLSATPLRRRYFESGAPSRKDPDFYASGGVPDAALDFLREFEETADYARLFREYEWAADYRRPYENLPHPPIFVTVDACVVQSGYVLLIQRRDYPGKDLWALPGGYLRSDARIEDWIYDELEQETRIEVPRSVLRGRTTRIETYDDVHRSSRGRTITHCGLIELETPSRRGGGRVPLPKVRGADDAKRARWFPLAGPGAIDPSFMFEDHYDIVQNLTAGL